MRQKSRLTGYAVRRCQQRGIPLDAIDVVLETYDTSRPAQPRPGARPATIYVGPYQGRRLKVYVVTGSEPPIVTTVAWEGDE